MSLGLFHQSLLVLDMKWLGEAIQPLFLTHKDKMLFFISIMVRTSTYSIGLFSKLRKVSLTFLCVELRRIYIRKMIFILFLARETTFSFLFRNEAELFDMTKPRLLHQGYSNFDLSADVSVNPNVDGRKSF